jgi:hypothetical protein
MTRKKRPEHPFPLLAQLAPAQDSQGFLPSVSFERRCHARPPAPAPRTPAQRRFCRLLQQGARVLLDLESGRCLVYSCANGLRVLAQMTIRTLSQLLRQGALVMAARENHWVHYAHPASNLAWFRPES